MSMERLLLFAVVALDFKLMDKRRFAFNPLRDKQAVEQFGFVDVRKVLETNAIPAEVSEGSEVYNGIDDPSSILGKPHDVFEAMAMKQAINDYTPPTNGGDNNNE